MSRTGNIPNNFPHSHPKTGNMPDIEDIDIDREIILEDFANEELWTRQTESDLLPPYTLEDLLVAAEVEIEGDESRPADERGLLLAARRILAERERDLALMGDKPLTKGFVADDIWLILRELCRKRVENPGDPLVLWLSGGIRSGKSWLFAMLSVCHWLYFRVKKCGQERKGSGIFAACTKMDKSPKLQQRPMKFFMPSDTTGSEKGTIKSTPDTKLKFSGGKFTDDRFLQFQVVEIETGEKFESGGECEFGAETQVEDEDTHVMQGIELTLAWLDEGKNPALMKTLRERATSGCVPTRQRWHRELMVQLYAKLKKAGTPEFERPTPYELGQLMLGVILNSYTPKDGWNSMAASLLTGAEFPEEYMRVAPELVDKPGCTDPRVPVIGFPADPLCLVGFLHTSQNKAVFSYPALSKMYREAPEEEIRKVLYGQVGRSDEVLFSHFSAAKHVVSWKDVPRHGTIMVVADGADSKPWFIHIVMWDRSNRYWVLKEWPCPGVKMWIRQPGGEVKEIDPGPWALPDDEGVKVNGKKGKIARTKIGWTYRDYTHLIWSMLADVLQDFAASGGAFTGDTITQKLEWHQVSESGQPGAVIEDLTLEGEFAKPSAFIGDKNWLGSVTRGATTIRKVHDVLAEQEHAHQWEAYEGRSARDGIERIQDALVDDIGGLPGLLVVDTCVNTIFGVKTYAIPDGKDSPPTDDQAAKEAPDVLRYGMTWLEQYVDSTPRGRTGRGFS